MKTNLPALRFVPAIFALSCFLPSAASAASVKDACTVFSSADAEAALGEPVGPPKPEDRSGGVGEGSACRFTSAQGRALTRKSVTLSVQYANQDVGGSSSGITQNLKSAGYKNVRDVSGVGDHAIWGTLSMMGKLTGELTVLKGKHTMVIVLIAGVPDEAVALERAKTLAAKVLPKT